MKNLLLLASLILLSGCAGSLPVLVARSEQNVVRVALVRRDAIGTIFPKRYIGGGVVVSPKGAILTCAHVVETNQNMGVQFFDKEFKVYRVVAVDVPNDLALMMPHEPVGWVPYTLLAMGVRKGESVYHIGHPFRMNWLVSAGVVSLVEEEVVVTDTVANPGSSGGALFNAGGYLIGIVHAGRGMVLPTYQGHTEATRPDVLWKFLKDNEALAYQ